jgi:Fe-S-cluster containining protein
VTAGCAGCGACCDPVVLDYDVYAAACERARAGETASDDDRFIAAHWHPVSGWCGAEGGGQAAPGVVRLDLRCDAFDPATRLCTARENRPPVCRDYPWYGDEPATSSRAATLYPGCSYLADVAPSLRPDDARPLIPLTVISG